MRQLVFLSCLAAAASGCAIVNVPLSLYRDADMREFVVRPAEGRLVTNKILLLDVAGFLTSEQSDSFFGPSSSVVADIEDALKKAEKDHRIKAVILRIDSPGGEVTASDVIYEQVRRFRQKRAEREQPVVILASLLGQGTSGAYYVALAADKIFAHPTCITGSIGVVATFPNLAGLTRKIGVDMRVVKSGDKKDLGSIWRDFAPEDREILQKTIDELYERFVEIVSRSRPEMDRQTIRRLADGRIYTAEQARDHKLIDGIAYLDEVIEKAKSQADIRDATVVTYRRTSGFQGGIYSRSPTVEPRTSARLSLLQINGENILGSLHKPGFYYIWMP